MKIHRAYKFKLRTTDRQAEQLSRFAGCCRLIWNKVLNLQKERLDRGETVLRYGQISAELPKWKQELPFLAEVHSQPLQQSLMDLDRALQEPSVRQRVFQNSKRSFSMTASDTHKE